MAKYRKVSVQIWNDTHFRQLTDDGKLAFIFVLTHPHMSAVGGMRATLSGLAEELGWTRERLSKAFAKPFERGMLWHDPEACLMALPNFVKHNPPESPNVVKAWIKSLDELPESPLKSKLYDRVSDCVKSLPEAFRKAFERLPKDFAYQEQEQEQDYISCAELAHEQAHAPDDAPGPEDEQPAPSPKPADAPPVYSLPCNGTKKIYHITAQTHVKLVAAYPGVDVMAEYAKMDAWLETNWTKRKTHGGMGKFINSWLGRAQNDARGQPRQSQPTLFAGPPEPQSVSNEECQRLYGY